MADEEDFDEGADEERQDEGGDETPAGDTGGEGEGLDEITEEPTDKDTPEVAPEAEEAPAAPPDGESPEDKPKEEGAEEEKPEKKEGEEEETEEGKKKEGEEEEEKPEEEKGPETPLTFEMMAESLSLLCKVGDGLAHAYVRLKVQEKSLTSIEYIKNYIHLRYIDLSKNALRDVSALSVLQHALTINLEENQISKINLEPIPYLQSLNLSKNKLISLEGCNHPLLEHLSANSNQMRLVRGLQPATLVRLQTLELRGNRLESVDAECLYALPSLKHLFLAQNQIARVDMLARLENLTTLHLRENAIEKLDSFSAPGSGADLLTGGATTSAAAANAAVGFKKLEYLNMRANRITILKEVSKLKRLPAIKAIVMSENPIAEESDYRMEVLMACRRLIRLDKDTYNDEEREEAVQTSDQRAQEEASQQQQQQGLLEGPIGTEGTEGALGADGTGLTAEQTGASSVLGDLPSDLN